MYLWMYISVDTGICICSGAVDWISLTLERLKTSLATALRRHHMCSKPTYWWTAFLLVLESTGSWNSSTVTPAQFLTLLVVSRQFLAFPVLLGLLSRYCACVTKAVHLLSIVLASFCYPILTCNYRQPYVPAAAINSFSDRARTDGQTHKHENCKVAIGPARHAARVRLVKAFILQISGWGSMTMFTPSITEGSYSPEGNLHVLGSNFTSVTLDCHSSVPATPSLSSRVLPTR